MRKFQHLMFKWFQDLKTFQTWIILKGLCGKFGKLLRKTQGTDERKIRVNLQKMLWEVWIPFAKKFQSIVSTTLENLKASCGSTEIWGKFRILLQRVCRTSVGGSYRFLKISRVHPSNSLKTSMETFEDFMCRRDLTNYRTRISVLFKTSWPSKCCTGLKLRFENFLD